jgi:hypothetical protein
MTARSIFLILGAMVSLSMSACKVTPPGHTETRLMQWSKRNVTIGGAHDKNPVTATHDNVEDGKKTFGY